MDRVLEVIFRQIVRLLVVITLLPIVGVSTAYFLPRSYQSIATLWALHPYHTIGATGTPIDPQSNSPLTPAQSQVNTLTELLGTMGFSVSVAKASSLAPTLNLDSSTLADPQLLDNAFFEEISHHVHVAALGYNTFTISYINQDPTTAQRVVAAVIQNYALQTQQLLTLQGQNLLQSDQKQLAQAKLNLDTALSAEANYLSAHPDGAKGTTSTDPQYILLQAQVQQANETYGAILKDIALLDQEINSGDPSNLFQVLDSPAPGLPVSRITSLVIGGVIGLGLAALASTFYVLILVRRDQAVYTTFDLQKVVAFPVVMQLPSLAPAAKELL